MHRFFLRRRTCSCLYDYKHKIFTIKAYCRQLLMALFVLLAALSVSACQLEAPKEEAVDKEKETAEMDQNHKVGETLSLPDPEEVGEITLEETLSQRTSSRNFSGTPLSLQEIGQLAWAAQGIGKSQDGITGATRTAPSAGGTHPLVVYVVAGEMEELDAGIYRYHTGGHELERVVGDDKRGALAAASLNQDFISEAPVTLVVAARYEATTRAYGDRGERYVKMEAGHAGQNLCLQAEALGMGCVVVGAFDDQEIKNILRTDTSPLSVIPIGFLENES